MKTAPGKSFYCLCQLAVRTNGTKASVTHEVGQKYRVRGVIFVHCHNMLCNFAHVVKAILLWSCSTCATSVFLAVAGRCKLPAKSSAAYITTVADQHYYRPTTTHHKHLTSSVGCPEAWITAVLFLHSAACFKCRQHIKLCFTAKVLENHWSMRRSTRESVGARRSCSTPLGESRS